MAANLPVKPGNHTDGARMNGLPEAYLATVPYARRLAAVGPALSKAARQRLQWMDHDRTHGQNAALTCRYFGISRQTFYTTTPLRSCGGCARRAGSSTS